MSRESLWAPLGVSGRVARRRVPATIKYPITHEAVPEAGNEYAAGKADTRSELAGRCGPIARVVVKGNCSSSVQVMALFKWHEECGIM